MVGVGVKLEKKYGWCWCEVREKRWVCAGVKLEKKYGWCWGEVREKIWLVLV